MPNHVIRDRIWESKKLRRCSREAALAYPWIFLVADDWGRFEFDPRRIWTKVFGARADVALEDVERWLGEYEREGLLERYHVDGEMAYWTRFEGRPPSKRRPSLLPDPAKWVPAEQPSGTDAVPSRYPLAEQSRDRAEQSKSGASAVPVNGSNGAPTYPLPPDEVTRSAIRGERWKHESELYKAVGEIAKRTGKEPGEVMAQVTAYKRGDGSIAPGRKRPELLRSDEAVEKSLADARAWLAQLEAKAKATA